MINKAERSYTARHGIDARANSALLRIESIIADRSIPSAIRLVMVAEIMQAEPILTDVAPDAYKVRAQRESYSSRRV